MLEICSNCYGDGLEPGEFESEVCPRCEGEGHLVDVTCDLCRGKGCPRCDEQGVLYEVECPTCQGQGEVEKPLRCTVCRGWKTVLPERIFKRSDVDS